MKISKAILAVSLMLMPVVAQADMTDQQIMEYVAAQSAKGTSQEDMAKYLIGQGVSPQRLMQLKRKYESMQQTSGTSSSASSSVDRMRTNNGIVPTKKSAGRTTTGRVAGDPAASNRFDAENEDFIAMKQALGYMIPDSIMPTVNQKPEPKIFGHDIFNNENISFEPNVNVSTPADYLLGPSDEIYIDIFGASQLTQVCKITPDGKIIVDDIGPISIGGLTVAEANKRVRNVIGSRYESSDISLTVGQTRTIMVNVMGEVVAPGTYTLSAFATLFQILYSAGGVTPNGTLRNIKLYRKNKVFATVDVYDYILNGRLSDDIRLQDNDVVVVGTYKVLANISGKVKNPMFYEMKESETAKQLLDYAGGFASDAYTKSLRLIRKQGGIFSVHNLDNDNLSSFQLVDGDSIAVDSMLTRFSNGVELKGEVFRPGMYELGTTVNSVKTLLVYSDGVTEDAFVAHGILHRMRSDRSIEVIQVDIDGILNGRVADIPLQNEDVLFVPSLSEMRQNRTITIHGEVYNPGVYGYAANMTLEDIILQAGGLRETASTVKVDIARRNRDSKATESVESLSSVYTFAVKDGFVIDGQTGFVLEPYDEVYVRRSPGSADLANVTVEGEVLFAGTYALEMHNERISSIIGKAGGITAFGNVRGARLIRRTTTEEKEKLLALKKSAESDSALMNLKIQETYSVGIDLEAALSNPGGDEDIVLMPNDRIVIPGEINTVKVSGAVLYPNVVAFESGKKAKPYVAQAGGYSNLARRRRAYIIYANGRVGKVRKGAKPEPGCEIVVPKKEERKNAMQTTTMWVSISSTLITMAAVLLNALK